MKSWRSAFRLAGLPGIALFCLLLGAMLQMGDLASGGAGHSNAKLMILVRAPACVFAFLLLLYRPRIAPIRITDTRFAYGAFAILYVVSVLWSQQPIQTIGKSAEMLLVGAVFFEASRAANPIRRVEALRQITLLTISALGLVTVIGYLLRLPAFIQQRAGLFSHTTAQAPFLSGNGLGYLASALFLVVMAEWWAHRLPRGDAFRQMAFALALFSLSASRTSFGILLLTMLVVVFKRSKILASLAIGAVGLGGWIFWSGIITRLQGNQGATGFATLSGRTIVWTAAVRQFEAHPFLGVGGGIGGKVVIAHIGNMYLEQLSSLHNGFLEVLTGLGLVGFVIGTYMLLLVSWRAWTAWDSNPEFAGTYVLIVHVWMTTIMSTGVLGWMGYEVAFFLCIVTNVDLLRQRARALNARMPVPVRWPSLALGASEQQLN